MIFSSSMKNAKRIFKKKWLPIGLVLIIFVICFIYDFYQQVRLFINLIEFNAK